MGVKNTNRGFTLLELTIVLAIIGFLIPVGFAMFLSSLRAQTKVLVIQEVKRNGDTALTAIENTIKTRAQSLRDSGNNPICATSGSSYSSGDIYFIDENFDTFRFYTASDRIASESSVIGSTNLTNDKVNVSSFTITCERDSTFAAPLITVSFIVNQAQSTTRTEEIASLNYRTKIRLRNY